MVQLFINFNLNILFVQGNRFSSYHLQNENNLDSNALSEMYDAVTIYPIKNVNTFYTLHAHFSKVRNF